MPTKKGSTKKVVSKKQATKPRAKKVVRPMKKEEHVCNQTCNPEHSFWVNNGPVVSTVCDLREAIKSMSDEQYQYHTLRAGNDFASWVRDCVGDAKLAERLAQSKTRAAAARVLGTCCK